MKNINKQLIVKIQNVCLAVAMLMLLVAAAFPLLGIMKEEMMLMPPVLRLPLWCAPRRCMRAKTSG